MKLKRELTNISKKVIPFRIDMCKEWTVKDAAKFILEKLEDLGAEKIDTLINAAGSVIPGPMECLSVEKIREQFEINTFSHIQLTQGLFEKLESGKIINISSMASFGIYPFIAPYCASKRALDILFNSMQLECWPDVKVISIKPGAVKTSIWTKTIENNKDILANNQRYEKEFKLLMESAERGNKQGMDAQKVADFIVKIEGLEKPKSSYTIGLDAKIAEILSHLPQDWINFLIRKSLEKRCS